MPGLTTSTMAWINSVFVAHPSAHKAGGEPHLPRVSLMTPVQGHPIRVSLRGRTARVVIPLAELRQQLTRDGEVALLGHVHYILRRLVADGDIRPGEADYFFDGERLEVGVPRPRARELAAVLTPMLDNPELVEPRPA